MTSRQTEFELPDDHRPYTDKYFLRSARLLRRENINPRARYQIFIRKGPGITAGIDEAIAAIVRFCPDFVEHGGSIRALRDGVPYESLETLMTIEGHVHDLMEIETLYLSTLSQRTAEANGFPDPDLQKVTDTVREITGILEKSKFGPRPLSYFGARHFGWEWDARLARAAYDGGAISASTDGGAATFGQEGVGTTPHALLLSFASKYGTENYAAEVMTAFRKHMPASVPTVFLAGTFNREITDTLSVARALGDRFTGPRFDTNGAVVAEGGVASDGRKYWTGKGVTVAGVHAARKAFDDAGFPHLKIALTSGFSHPEKVRVFTEAEEKYGCRLFDFLGAGFADGRHTATSDIVGFYQEDGSSDGIARNVTGFKELHKVGRPIRENPRLEDVDLAPFR